MDYLAHLTVIQHTSADYLGLVEDHLEGRKIRFTYHRPFTERGGIPTLASIADGLVLLGGGPWGSAGPRNLPTLVREVELAHACLARGLPVIGFELGAQILALAAGGRTHAAPLALTVEQARRVDDAALNGYLPEHFVSIACGRDRFELPAQARVLALGEDDAPALFQVGDNAFGFRGHPGFKPAIAEDLVMEFEEAPDDPAAALIAARAQARAVEEALIPIMTGLVQLTGWMGSAHAARRE
ncbi:MAG: hypothetical protein RLW61_07355 [Gammaproteobacteria bacterium]